MKNLLLIISLFATSNSFAQFYYNDIVANEQSSIRYQTLLSNKINKISTISLNDRNEVDSGFSLIETINPISNQSTIVSKLGTGKTSVIINSYQNQKIIKSEETSNNIITTINYGYDDNGKIKTITSLTVDTSFQSQETETHVWIYNNNKPQQMWKIKNKTDSVAVNFVYDEQGNLVEEHWRKKNIEQETYFYYYNDKKLLTDIVRFDKRIKKLVPVFVFDYDSENHVNKSTQALSNNDYLIWNYVYNTQGLKQEEICMDKQKQIVGKIKYKYE